jgi:hypothetical protein
MRKRRLGTIIVRSLISTCLFALLFISVAELNTKTLIGGLFEDIFEYSDSASKTIAIEKLDSACDSILYQDSSILQIKELCENQGALKEIEDNCNKYYLLRETNEVKYNKDLEKTCQRVLSGQIREQCKSSGSIPTLDIDYLSTRCELHKNNLISNKEFFSSFMLSISQVPELTISKINNTLLATLLCVIIILLTPLLFLLHKKNLHNFLFSIGRIIFNIGVMIIIIFSVLFIYKTFVQPDTSFILQSISNTPNSNMFREAVILLIPFIFARIFNELFFITGIIMVVVGLTVKLVSKRLKEQ